MRHRYEIEGQEFFKEIASKLIENEISFTTYLSGLKMIVVEPIQFTKEKVEDIVKQFENKATVKRYVEFYSEWYEVKEFHFGDNIGAETYDLINRWKKGEGSGR